MNPVISLFDGLQKYIKETSQTRLDLKKQATFSSTMTQIKLQVAYSHLWFYMTAAKIHHKIIFHQIKKIIPMLLC